MGRLDGKVALVTGAARGTGEATARLFVAEGARVMLTDVLRERGEAVADELGASAHFEPLDVTSPADWQRAVRSTTRRWGDLHALVNNAAVLHMAAIADTKPEDFERVMRVNQLGTFLGIQAAIEPMQRAAGGSIVNVSSVDGLRGQAGVMAYAASKWAVRGMTRVAALELGRFGIRVNCVCPAAGSGEMIAPYLPPGIDPEQAAAYDQRVLAYERKRSIRERVEDVARLILFLASDESASCTGADFPIEGGQTAGRVVRGAPGS